MSYLKPVIMVNMPQATQDVGWTDDYKKAHYCIMRLIAMYHKMTDVDFNAGVLHSDVMSYLMRMRLYMKYPYHSFRRGG